MSLPLHRRQPGVLDYDHTPRKRMRIRWSATIELLFIFGVWLAIATVALCLLLAFVQIAMSRR